MAGLARRSLATLITFVLLAGVGFTLGALAGILWEQPRLVLAYLTGGTTEIAWTGEDELPDVGAAPAPLPPVAAVPEPPKRPKEPATPEPPAPKPGPREKAPPPPPVPAPPALVEQAPPPLAAAPPAARKGRYAVQVGAFGRSESAERLVARLSRAGYDAYVTPGAGQGNARWRVRVGPVPDKASAESLAARLKKREKLPTWILDESGG